MGPEGSFPAMVYLHEGALQRRLEGYYTTQLVGCKYGKTDLVWPIADYNGEAEHELDGEKPRRVFHVDLDIPDMEIPFPAARRSVLDWRKRVLKAASDDAGQVDKIRLRQAIQAEGGSGVTSTYLANVLKADMKPDVTAKILKRTWMEGLLVKGEAAWPLVIGALIFGLLEGWQLADTILPNIARSPWFNLLLPAALVAFVIMMAIKEG